jgi:pantothenate synthetase
VVAVPTVREADGLALSSRNRFLAPAERASAPVLHRVLTAAAAAIAKGGAVEPALEAAKSQLRAAGLAPDYLALVHAESLEPMAAFVPPARLIAAAKLGTVRLLDNVPV